MARCPLVVPDLVRVPLSGGEWVEFKRELNAGEYRDMLIAQWKTSPGEGSPVLDLHQVGMNTVVAYTVNWSFVDFDGKPLAVTPGVFTLIDHETFREIRDKAEAHHAAWEREVEARKNVPAGVST